MKKIDTNYTLHVVFTYSPKLNFVDKELNHVYTIRETKSCWIRAEKCWSHLDTTVFEKADYPTLDDVIRADTVQVITVDVEVAHKDSRWALGIMTCVSLSKLHLSLRERWILTPRQLFNHLVDGNSPNLTLK